MNSLNNIGLRAAVDLVRSRLNLGLHPREVHHHVGGMNGVRRVPGVISKPVHSKVEHDLSNHRIGGSERKG